MSAEDDRAELELLRLRKRKAEAQARTQAPAPVAPPAEGMNPAAAAAHKFLQGYTQEFGDEAIGQLTKVLAPLRLKQEESKTGLMAGMRNPVTGEIAGPQDTEKLYRAGRDIERQKQEQAGEALGFWQHPISIAGDIAGQATAGALVPGLGRILTSPLGQGLVGAMRALGASKANLQNPETGDVAQAGLESLLGGATSGLTGLGVQRLGQAASRKFGGWADREAARSVVNAKKDVERMTEMSMADRAARKLAEEQGLPVPKSQLEQLGRRMLDEELIPQRSLNPLNWKSWMSAENIADEAAVRGLSAAEDIKQSLSGAQAAAEAGRAASLAKRGLGEAAELPAGVPPWAIAQRIEERIAPNVASPAAQLGGGLTKAQEVAAAYGAKPGVMSFPAAHAERVKLDQAINWDQLNPVVANEIKRDVRESFEKELESQLERQAGPNALDAYKTAKDAYGFASQVSRAADTPMSRALANRTFSLSDHLVGQAAAQQAPDLSNATLLGLIGAMGNKFARERGSTALARIEDDIAKSLARGGGVRAVPAAVREAEPAELAPYLIRLLRGEGTQ